MTTNYFSYETTEGFTKEECEVINEWIERHLTNPEDQQEIKNLQERAFNHADEILNEAGILTE